MKPLSSRVPARDGLLPSVARAFAPRKLGRFLLRNTLVWLVLALVTATWWNWPGATGGAITPPVASPPPALSPAPTVEFLPPERFDLRATHGLPSPAFDAAGRFMPVIEYDADPPRIAIWDLQENRTRWLIALPRGARFEESPDPEPDGFWKRFGPIHCTLSSGDHDRYSIFRGAQFFHDEKGERLVIAAPVRPASGERTRLWVLWIDLARGRLIDAWEPSRARYACSLSPDGGRLLLTASGWPNSVLDRPEPQLVVLDLATGKPDPLPIWATQAGFADDRRLICFRYEGCFHFDLTTRRCESEALVFGAEGAAQNFWLMRRGARPGEFILPQSRYGGGGSTLSYTKFILYQPGLIQPDGASGPPRVSLIKTWNSNHLSGLIDVHQEANYWLGEQQLGAFSTGGATMLAIFMDTGSGLASRVFGELSPTPWSPPSGSGIGLGWAFGARFIHADLIAFNDGTGVTLVNISEASKTGDGRP